MGQVKPWQIVLMVAAVVAMAASAYFTLGGSGIKLEDEVLLVDITTGDLYAFPTGGHRAIVCPAKNPDTGKIALFRVFKNGEGAWAVSSRDLGALGMVEGEPKALLDRKTGASMWSATRPSGSSRKSLQELGQ